MYETLFCPAKSTLQNAIKNNFLSEFPYINGPKNFKYIEEIDATIKGHLDTEQKNTWSTKKSTIITDIKDNKKSDTLVFCTI